MDLLLALIIALAVIGGGVSPVWSYSHEWGYYPMSGAFFLFVVLVIIYALRGRNTTL